MLFSIRYFRIRYFRMFRSLDCGRWHMGVIMLLRRHQITFWINPPVLGIPHLLKRLKTKSVELLDLVIDRSRKLRPDEEAVPLKAGPLLWWKSSKLSCVFPLRGFRHDQLTPYRRLRG